MIEHRELLILKNLSCSPMSFATKILFKIFKIDELHGHNVSGKTLNKNLKAKLPLDPIRIGYIKFLVEKYYDEKECKEMLHGATSTKQDLWKSCHTAINKSILISERKAALAALQGDKGKKEDKKDEADKSEDKKRRRSFSSSTDDEFDDCLESEEFDSDEEDDEDEIEMFKNQSVNRKPKRLKTKKSTNSQSDESNESDEDEYANEIELIQNIENRLVNPKLDEKAVDKSGEEEDKNDEALAAANIAAAM